MSTSAIDVLMVGGGPAGLAAGISFGRAGLRTVVCERGSLPADKPCGEGVMPTGLRHLERLGVSAYLRPEHMRPFVGIHYLSAAGAGASARFAEGPGQGIRRTELSRALWERAATIDAVEVRSRTGVTLGTRGPGGTRAWLDDREVIARLVVGADGINSRVRRWAGLQGVSRRRRRFAVQQHFRCRPWSEYVEVHWAGGVEAYVTPCGPQEVGVAFLWAPEGTDGGGPGLIGSMLSRFPRLRTSLEGAESSAGPRAIGPLHQVARAPMSDGVALVGDASGYLDAITGEGISLALAQVQALYDTIGPWLLRGSDRAPTARDLQSYSRRISAMVHQHHLITRLVLFLSRHPGLADRAIQGLGRQPELFRWLLSANMGAVSLESVPGPDIVRLATRLVRA